MEFQAGKAFGSGNHPSTQGCLLAMQAMQEQSFNCILDVGCGSGVLSIVAAHLWKTQVIAVDIEKQAVEDTLQNAEANKVAIYVAAFRSNGYDAQEVKVNAPYDLVICNVLADPLITWAAKLKEVMADKRLAILSGLLLWQCDTIIEVHESLGFKVINQYQIDDWVTLVLQKT